MIPNILKTKNNFANNVTVVYREIQVLLLDMQITILLSIIKQYFRTVTRKKIRPKIKKYKYNELVSTECRVLSPDIAIIILPSTKRHKQKM